MDICYNTETQRVGSDRTLTDGQLWAWTSGEYNISKQFSRDSISFCVEVMETLNRSYFEPEVVDQKTLYAWLFVKDYLQEICVDSLGSCCN